MELRRYLAVIRRRIILIALLVVIAGAISYQTRPKSAIYVATTTIYVGSRQLQGAESTNDRTQVVDRASRTFSLMIPSPAIAREGVILANVPRSPAGVAAATRALAIANTSLIRVQVRDTDPAVAQALANGVSDAFTKKVQEYEPGTPVAGDLPTLPAYVFQRASLPVQPEPNDFKGQLVLAILVALVLGVGVAFLLDALDLTIRDPDDLEERTGIPVLGVLPSHHLTGAVGARG